MDICIITPPVAESKIDCDLVEITKLINAKDPEVVHHGCLGGEFGYGGDYENDVFMMHSYCWCEQEDCEWCKGCKCPDSAFTYFKDGKEITAEQYNKEFYNYAGKMPHEMGYKFGSKKYVEYDKEWDGKIKERNKRYEMKHEPMCDYCKNGSAPNFWHKKSGFKVWWYKWIGRDGKYSEEISLKEWNKIFNECIESLEATQQ